MKDTVPLTEVVPFLWKRLVCFFKDHEMMALIRWSPEVVCMHLVCGRCGKELGHIDIPQKTSTKKESLH